MAFLWIHVPIIRIWYSNLRKCYIKMLYISYKFTIMKEVLIIMWIADGWKEYEVIDTSKGEKPAPSSGTHTTGGIQPGGVYH